MSTRATEADMVRAVCADPAADLPRLAFADWLDEHDRPERAEFIRRSVGSGLAFYPESISDPPPFCDEWPYDVGWVGFRGFVSKLTCTAAEWLAHADAIAWHPGQTAVCQRCEGSGRVWRNHPGGRGTVDCPACDGIGRAPRPCPPTAQPVVSVTWTTVPDDDEMIRLGARVTNRAGGSVWEFDPWPGVTFTLPVVVTVAAVAADAVAHYGTPP